MKKYEYMVVYSVRGGVGRIKITSEKLIQSYDDVESLDNIMVCLLLLLLILNY